MRKATMSQVAVTAAVVVTVIIVILAWSRSQHVDIATSDPSSTPEPENIFERPLTPGAPDPIVDAEHAISRSIALLPRTAYTTGVVARLVSEHEVGILAGSISPQDSVTTPVWVVAFEVHGLSEDELLEPIGLGSPYPYESSIVAATANASWVDPTYVPEGVFYAWDANDGALISAGSLPVITDTSNVTFQSIVQWVNQGHVIVTASPPPIVNGPFSTPTPNSATADASN